MSDDASLLVGSGMAAQGLNLLAYPFLTEMYAPESFGVFSLITALANFCGAAIFLRLDTVFQIVDPQHDDSVLSAAVVVGIGISLTLVAFLLVFGNWSFGVFTEEHTWRAAYAVVVPALALMNGLFALSRQYAAKNQRYRHFSLANFSRTLCMIVGQLVLVLVLPGPAGLIAGFGIGLFIALWIAWPLPPPLLSAALFAPYTAFLKAKVVLRLHGSFIRLDVINALIGASVLTIYPIIVLFSFGAEEAGFFAIASRLTFILLDVLGAAISTVYFQRFSHAVRQTDSIVRLYARTVLGAIAMAATIIVVIVALVEPFVRIAFPPEWARVSTLILCLLPTFMIRFVVLCINTTSLSLGRPRILLVWNTAQISVLLTAWCLAHNCSLDLFLLIGGGGLMACGTIYIGVLAKIVIRYGRHSVGTSEHHS